MRQGKIVIPAPMTPVTVKPKLNSVFDKKIVYQ
jgi:hypothetical protein